MGYEPRLKGTLLIFFCKLLKFGKKKRKEKRKGEKSVLLLTIGIWLLSGKTWKSALGTPNKALNIGLILGWWMWVQNMHVSVGMEGIFGIWKHRNKNSKILH